MTDCKNLELARQWAADIDADRQTLSQDTIDAAADLISSLPDAWVDADTLRKYISDWREGLATAPRGNYESEMLDDLEDMLPAPPAPRTMADMSPEERSECQWMQAEDDVGNHVIITELDEENQECKVLYENGGQFDWSYEILVPLPHLPRMEWPGNEPGDEVSTVAESENVGPEQQALARDIFGSFPPEERHVHWAKPIPKPAAPRPEDVPVGEPWQVEVGGQAAIGYRNDPENTDTPWNVVYPNYQFVNIDHPSDDEVTLIARLVPETTEQAARIERLDTELDAVASHSLAQGRKLRAQAAQIERVREALKALRDYYIDREARSRERLESATDEREQFQFARFEHMHRRTHEALTRILEAAADHAEKAAPAQKEENDE